MPVDFIPVAYTGAGSQPEEADGSRLEYISLPTEMSRYRAPDIPEPGEIEHLRGARAALDWLGEALAAYRVGDEPQIADISALDAANRELVNQVLGEGEVSLTYSDGLRAVMQESVLAGIWRTFYVGADGGIARDLIEVCDVPVLARRAPRPDGIEQLVRAAGGAAAAMNAPAIMAELAEQVRRWHPGAPAHVVNLTLLPLSEADLQFLEDALGRGPVHTLSRGYGDCQIGSTAWPGIWRVRFTNSMGTLILDTLEVTDIPAVACAAQEDLDDSALRFRELLEPYRVELT